VSSVPEFGSSPAGWRLVSTQQIAACRFLFACTLSLNAGATRLGDPALHRPLTFHADHVRCDTSEDSGCPACGGRFLSMQLLRPLSHQNADDIDGPRRQRFDWSVLLSPRAALPLEGMMATTRAVLNHHYPRVRGDAYVFACRAPGCRYRHAFRMHLPATTVEEVSEERAWENMGRRNRRWSEGNSDTVDEETLNRSDPGGVDGSPEWGKHFVRLWSLLPRRSSECEQEPGLAATVDRLFADEAPADPSDVWMLHTWLRRSREIRDSSWQALARSVARTGVIWRSSWSSTSSRGKLLARWRTTTTAGLSMYLSRIFPSRINRCPMTAKTLDSEVSPGFVFCR